MHLKKLTTALLTLSLVLSGATTAQAITRDTPQLASDLQTVPSDCTRVGLYGSYANDITAALTRINEIRKEACNNGYRNPSNQATKLTPSDYRPLKWSTELEYIARIRAAEASVLTVHARPNGKAYNDLFTPEGHGVGNEVLAWQSWSGGLVDAINNWYQEKTAWVNGGNGVTGHYTAMINPNYTHTGIATFLSPSGSWYASSAGKFDDASDLSETPYPAAKNIIQQVDILTNHLTAPTIAMEGELLRNLSGKAGKTADLDMVYEVNFNQDYALSYVLETVNWSSSNTNVATVSADGIVSFKKAGSTTITAALANGDKASVAVTVTGTSSLPGTAINPIQKSSLKAPTLKTLTAGKKKCTVKWSKVNEQGYEVQYSTKSSFKNCKSKVITKGTTTKTVIKSLKSKKKYYFRVRSLRQNGVRTYASKWSKVKKIKIK